MKQVILFAMVVMALAGCRATQAQPPDVAAPGTPQPGLPNPATVFCTERGNRHEIRTVADGSQQGICIFPDGSTCDEWAYFRGECAPAAAPTAEATTEASGGGSTGDGATGGYIPPETAEPIANWWGTIQGNGTGAQFDDCFERRDLGQVILFGIDSLDPALRAQLQALRDSGKIVHVWGTLLSNVPDCNGSQVQVERVEVEP